ncbi:kinase/pyrophosphorylase [Mycoplasmatota bacterium]|nr:kinase/pyrophosphorylase [Mycoplasmatota bacterium]
MRSLIIYVISDSIGETGEQVAKSVISQFEIENYEIRKYSHVLEEDYLKVILEQATKENSIIIYTLVEQRLSHYVNQHCEELQIPYIDLLTPLLNAIAYRTNLKPLREPGINRLLDDKYFKRVEAIEFAVKYDDGKDPRGILKADLVLIGVSRTSKTPLSMYLANKNLLVANVPLVPETPVPKELFQIPSKKILGLTNSPENLNIIRQERLKALGLSGYASYASLERILEEIEYSEKIMKKLGCPIIDISSKAIEETAGIILNLLKKNGFSIIKDN